MSDRSPCPADLHYQWHLISNLHQACPTFITHRKPKNIAFHSSQSFPLHKPFLLNKKFKCPNGCYYIFEQEKVLALADQSHKIIKELLWLVYTKDGVVETNHLQLLSTTSYTVVKLTISIALLNLGCEFTLTGLVKLVCLTMNYTYIIFVRFTV